MKFFLMKKVLWWKKKTKNIFLFIFFGWWKLKNLNSDQIQNMTKLQPVQWKVPYLNTILCISIHVYFMFINPYFKWSALSNNFCNFDLKDCLSFMITDNDRQLSFLNMLLLYIFIMWLGWPGRNIVRRWKIWTSYWKGVKTSKTEGGMDHQILLYMNHR